MAKRLIPYGTPLVDAFDFGMPDFLTSYSHERGDIFHIPADEFGVIEWFQKAADWVLSHSAKFLVFENLKHIHIYSTRPFFDILAKLHNSSRKHVLLVPYKGTSMCCPQCRSYVESFHKTIFECRFCDFVTHRQVVAPANLYDRGINKLNGRPYPIEAEFLKDFFKDRRCARSSEIRKACQYDYRNYLRFNDTSEFGIILTTLGYIGRHGDRRQSHRHMYYWFKPPDKTLEECMIILERKIGHFTPQPNKWFSTARSKSQLQWGEGYNSRLNIQRFFASYNHFFSCLQLDKLFKQRPGWRVHDERSNVYYVYTSEYIHDALTDLDKLKLIINESLPLCYALTLKKDRMYSLYRNKSLWSKQELDRIAYQRFGLLIKKRDTELLHKLEADGVISTFKHYHCSAIYRLADRRDILNMVKKLVDKFPTVPSNLPKTKTHRFRYFAKKYISKKVFTGMLFKELDVFLSFSDDESFAELEKAQIIKIKEVEGTAFIFKPKQKINDPIADFDRLYEQQQWEITRRVRHRTENS